MNLKTIIQEELKEFDAIIDRDCLKTADEKYENLQQFIQDFGNRIAKETAEAIRGEKRLEHPKGEIFIHQEIGFNQAIEEQNTRIDNWF